MVQLKETEPVPRSRAGTDVTLHTSDGLELSGRWHAAPSARATAVLVHGFSAGRDDPAVCALAQDLLEAELNVLTYDARGHGASGGDCGVGSTEHLDVECAVEQARASELPVVLVGVSMGAIAVVNYLAAEPPPMAAESVPGPLLTSGAVLVSAPARWRMKVSPLGILTAALTRTKPGRYVAARRLRVRVARRWHAGEPPEATVRRIGLPLAIVHGTGDRLLAVVHGRQLHASAAGPSRLDVVEGMGHGIDELCRKSALDSINWILSLDPSLSPTTRPDR